MYVEFEMMELQNFGFWGFCSKLRNEVPALQNMHAEMMKITFRDDQGDWVDAGEKTFSKFLGAAVYDSKFGPNPRISVKVFEGSPMVSNKSSDIRVSHNLTTPARKGLNFNNAQAYLSPIQLDIKIKDDEYKNQKFEYEELCAKVQSLQDQYSVRVAEDKTIPLCGNCHLRISKSHNKRNCKATQCDDVRICGNLASHENAKLKLKELTSARDKAEGLMKKLKAELDAKIKMEEIVNQSFEAKIKPFLINSNQGKYLFDGYKERSRLILADTAILRKHYKGIIPTNIENESNKWQEIIKIFEERHVPKQKVSNPVRQLLEANPVHNVQFPQIPNIPMTSFPMSGLSPYQYIWAYPPMAQPSTIARGAATAALGCPNSAPYEPVAGLGTNSPSVQQLTTAGESDTFPDDSRQLNTTIPLEPNFDTMSSNPWNDI
ncbi:hypothetical protein FSP39_002111 [Pinctada imbricata]|uniref:Uncharacterized protein n=1 Tax=Pinctada imbricata TaxID=66713 RepID=A0AA88YFM2_PINIB|nr:hypothetical protein FSP39_002111 [Pinctada imbricata]